jgi:hypothetical protein
MRRLCIGIAVAVVGVLLVPGVAGSAAKKKHKVDVSVRAAVVGTSGDSNIVAGTLSGPPAEPVRWCTGARRPGPTSRPSTRRSTRGAPCAGRASSPRRPQPDGTVSFSGTLQIKGGTGRYRGAKGKDLKVTGALANNVITFHITGSVRY